MIDTSILSILDILPNSVTTEETEALSYALTPELQEITKAISEALIYARIDELDEDFIDLLAWQFHVDFYEPLGLSLEKKRALVKNSLIWHRYKGTKSVVEEIVRLIFFENFNVQEWFEYGGRPYFFRAIAGSEPMQVEALREVIKAINATKNERSWLDYIKFVYETYTNTYSVSISSFMTKEYIIVDTEPLTEDPIHVSATVKSFISREIIIEQGSLAEDTKHISATVPQLFSKEYISEQTPFSENLTNVSATGTSIFAREKIKEET